MIGFFVSDELTERSESKIPNICNEETLQDTESKVMINVLKLNKEKKGDLDAYVQGAVMGLFPKIGSYIIDAGEAVSDYWTQVLKEVTLIWRLLAVGGEWEGQGGLNLVFNRMTKSEECCCFDLSAVLRSY